MLGEKKVGRALETKRHVSGPVMRMSLLYAGEKTKVGVIAQV